MVIIGDKSIKEIVGVVVSTKMDKTIVVSTDSVVIHPLYRKRYVRMKKFYAHDQENKANVGDTVKIRETKPFSKTKKRKLIEIVEAAVAEPTI